MPHKKHQLAQWMAAFSLMEVAIVLIIVGILTGLSLKGYGLIEQARLKTIPSQVEEIHRSVILFQERYHAWPGDYSQARNHFGPEIPQGNGDGIISGSGIDYPQSEAASFWVHLKASGLYDGTQVPDAVSAEFRGGKHTPTAKTGGCFTIAHYWQQQPGPWLVLSEMQGNTYTGGLTPVQAQELDALMDDGSPNTGSVRAENIASNPISCTDQRHTGSYNLKTKDKACVLFFKLS